MIILLSPTKTQSTLIAKNHCSKTKPFEIKKANYLMSLLAELTVDDLSRLMKTSNAIAVATKNAIDSWGKNEIPSIYLFQGDAFQKLDVQSFNHDELLFAQDHVIILSALYAYWKETVTSGLNTLLTSQKNNIVLNLASNEYFDVIEHKKLNGKIIQVEFKVQTDKTYKTVGVYAKRGRGLLARYIIQNSIESPEKIVCFNSEGFQFSEKLSTPDNYVFILKSGK
jgi:cytoplasmic iron level regulating protein YaaA (DUF328/UPF0246 family)